MLPSASQLSSVSLQPLAYISVLLPGGNFAGHDVVVFSIIHHTSVVSTPSLLHVQSVQSAHVGGPFSASALAPDPWGIVLSPDCKPIPAKLVERVRSGQFVEMRDFLPDNIKLMDKLHFCSGGGVSIGLYRPYTQAPAKGGSLSGVLESLFFGVYSSQVRRTFYEGYVSIC